MPPAATPVDIAGLVALAGRRASVPGAYAGEVTPQEAWAFLQQHKEAFLVDVRTQPEWQFTGLPEMASTQARLLTLSWKTYPGFSVNPQFVDQLKAEGATPATPLFFLCRSGGRSLDAAITAAQAGFAYAFNITDGFEGEPDAARHRGTQGGWKACGLPWVQG